jgi:V-type H+-transporting ATPase 21kDa proteolipid subunit
MIESLMSPMYWLVIPYLVAVVCFCIQVGDPEKFIDYEWLWTLFQNISPYFWAAMGVVIAVAMSILGAAWCGFSAFLTIH